MTSRQRAYLKGLANKIDARYQLGKDGIDGNFTSMIDKALEAKELIKVHVLNNSDLSAKDACNEICRLTKAYPIQVIGSRFVIYRESKENPQISLSV